MLSFLINLPLKVYWWVSNDCAHSDCPRNMWMGGRLRARMKTVATVNRITFA